MMAFTMARCTGGLPATIVGSLLPLPALDYKNNGRALTSFMPAHMNTHWLFRAKYAVGAIYFSFN